MSQPARFLLAALVVLQTGSVYAQTVSAPGADGRVIPMSGGKTGQGLHNLALEAGSGRVVTLPGGAANIFVADPKVLEVRPASATSLFMFGVAAGHTTVAAMDASGHPVSQFEVTVRPSTYGSSETEEMIARQLPGADVKVEITPKTLILSGRVKDARSAERAEQIAHAFLVDGQTVDNRITVTGSVQVGLRVRIVEMKRSVTRALGIQWTGGRQGTNVFSFQSLTTIAETATGVGAFAASQNANAVLDAMAQDNLIRTLAEPTLVTTSGETASFLAGGEYPIPVSSTNGAVSITYKQYGVQLAFVPTVLSDRQISLHVRPEVSDVSSTNSVSLSSGSTSTTQSSSGLSVPSLTVRRADTTIVLGSGQSFAIAGLLQDNVNHSVNAFPFLGDVPVLGALFRSDDFQRDQSELVIVVTPFIVEPVSDPSTLHVPGQDYRPPNDLDRIVRMHQVEKNSTMPVTRASTSAGFLVE